MKEREKQILECIIDEGNATLDSLLEYFKISKRTLYYDIESINFHIRHSGQVKNMKGTFVYIGQYQSLQEILDSKVNSFEDQAVRVNHVLYKILEQQNVTIDSLSQEMDLSKNTVVQVFEDVKDKLKELNLTLESKPKYDINGIENTVRNLYIMLMQEDNNLLNTEDERVLSFDRKWNLNLTDYSISQVSKMLRFIEKRNRSGHFIEDPSFAEEVKNFVYYEGISTLLENKKESEKIYLCGYIATCSSLDTNMKVDVIDAYADSLIYKFEGLTTIFIDKKKEFKRNIQRHLLSSYYRIKFRFPISNPSLDEIKLKHSSLFRIIKSILENESDFPDFKGIREEEVGFITSYFGGYLRGNHMQGVHKNKVLLVCPNGLMVSKNLEIQLYQTIPMIEVVDTVALKELSSYEKDYDYIVSTINLVGYENVIVVNPLLTKLDIDRLMHILVDSSSFGFFDVDSVLSIVRQYSRINDEVKLKNELLKLAYQVSVKEIGQPMLKELISKERIKKIKQVSDWKEAIRLASQCLIEDGSIEASYIDEMISSVEEHGPYIVLADRFALPHASMNSGVHKLSMSLLVVEEEVDLLGKPVNLFMVLATVDKNSHMRALASLSELLYDKANLEIFRVGNSSEIMNLINSQE